MNAVMPSLEVPRTNEQAGSSALAGPEAQLSVTGLGKSGDKDPVELLPWLPCTLVLEVPVVMFSVGTLLNLKVGGLVETAWHQSTDIPMRVNGLLMAWTEFEVVGERLAARITDLV
jgi:flagellar motor switch/type III secretory pathway protein FliN